MKQPVRPSLVSTWRILFIVLWIGLLTIPSSLSAQREISLSDCLQQKRQESTVPVEREWQSRIDKEKYRILLQKMLPQAEASASWLHTPTRLQPIPLPEGISIPPVIYEQLPDILKGFSPYNIYVGQLSVKQPLFAGGQLIRAVELLEIERKGHQLQSEIKSRNQETELIALYIQTAAVARQTILLDRFIQMLSKTIQDLDTLEAHGVVSGQQALEMRLVYNEVELSRTEAQDGLLQLKEQLRFMAKFPEGMTFSLIEEIEPNLPVFSVDSLFSRFVPISSDTTAGNILLRPEIQALQLNVQARSQKALLEQGRMFPRLGVSGHLLSTYPNVFRGFKKELGLGWMIGLSLQIPLTEVASAYRSMRMARAEEQLALMEQQKGEEGLRQQLLQTEQNLRRTVQKVLQTQKMALQAQENLDLSQTGFDEGVIEISTLTRAQEAWFKAQLARIRAIEQWMQACLHTANARYLPLPEQLL